MSHLKRCQNRDRCISERQLKNGSLCTDKAFFAIWKIPVGILVNRCRLVLLVVIIFGWAGLFSSWITPALAQDVSETEKVGESAESNQPTDDDAASAEPVQESVTRQPAENLWIPAVLPDGRRITPIGMYQSQMDELVPTEPIRAPPLLRAVRKLLPGEQVQLQLYSYTHRDGSGWHYEWLSGAGSGGGHPPPPFCSGVRSSAGGAASSSAGVL